MKAVDSLSVSPSRMRSSERTRIVGQVSNNDFQAHELCTSENTT